MNRICTTLILALSLTLPLPSAADDIPRDDRIEAAGFGIGALVGGLIAGPPGAIIGAAGGALYGNHETEKNRKLAAAEKQLQDKAIELTYLQQQFNEAQSRHEEHIQRVKRKDKQELLQIISEGFSFSVYFRTGQSDIDATLLPHVQELASLVNDLPDIKIMIEAHADKRGDDIYNLELSEARANEVRNILHKAGLSDDRILRHAYGEDRARADGDDEEGYLFDRRVDIHLTTDTEV